MAVALAAVLGACTDYDFYDDKPPPNSGGPEIAETPALSAAEIRIYLTDSTLAHRDEERVWSVYVDEDGSLRGLSEPLKREGGAIRASGRWTVFEDGRVCVEWSGVWDPADTGCAHVRQEGALFLFTSAEDTAAEPLIRRREAGNPRGL